jgi:hypothetical protein
MSSKPKATGGFNPAPATFTIDELERLGAFFQKLIAESKLRWAIVAAGIAAILEIVHLCWLAARFLLKF